MINENKILNNVKKNAFRLTFLTGIVLFIFAITVSQISIWQSRDYFQGSTDERGYINYAVNSLNGRGFNEFPGYNQSNRVPLYPFLIAGIFKVFGHSFFAVKMVQSIILALSVVLIFIIGKSIFNTPTGVIAGILASINPNFLRDVHFIMTENFFTFFFLLSIFFLIHALIYEEKINYFFFGISLGFTSLIRPTTVYFPIYLLFMCLFIFWKQRVHLKNIFKGLFVACLVSFLIFLPWVARNCLIHKNFVFLSTQGPRVFAVSMHKISATERSDINILSADFYNRVERLTDYGRYQEFKRLVKGYFSENPNAIWKLIKIIPKRLVALWSLKNTLILGSYLGFSTPIKFDFVVIPIAFLGIITGLFSKRKSSLLLISIILYFNLIHCVVIADPRYRVSFMPFVIIFASYFICFISRKIWRLF